MPLNNGVPYGPTHAERYRQGDILRDIRIIEWAETRDDGEIEITERQLQYCVVLSQECDLEHDFNNRNTLIEPRTHDKFLPSLLLCPAFPAEQLRRGEHIVGLTMQSINSNDFKRLKQNNNYRYHFLPENQEKQIPDLVLDFKQYITIPRDIAYRKPHRDSVLASLNDLFREHLSSRFAHYLSRIGLPETEGA